MRVAQLLRGVAALRFDFSPRRWRLPCLAGLFSSLFLFIFCNAVLALLFIGQRGGGQVQRPVFHYRLSPYKGRTPPRGRWSYYTRHARQRSTPHVIEESPFVTVPAIPTFVESPFFHVSSGFIELKRYPPSTVTINSLASFVVLSLSCFLNFFSFLSIFLNRS